MSSHTYLDKIIEAKRRRLTTALAARSLEDVRAAALDARRDAVQHAFRRALADASRVNVIAEFKRASPSKGEINAAASAAETARRYAAGGARALSVLTEEDFFRGSLEDLREAKRACTLPVLRKDFVFDAFQIYEAAEAGADAVLLIVAALSDDALATTPRRDRGRAGDGRARRGSRARRDGARARRRAPRSSASTTATSARSTSRSKCPRRSPRSPRPARCS